jgi:hypothetical protein
MFVCTRYLHFYFLYFFLLMFVSTRYLHFYFFTFSASVRVCSRLYILLVLNLHIHFICVSLNLSVLLYFVSAFHYIFSRFWIRVLEWFQRRRFDCSMWGRCSHWVLSRSLSVPVICNSIRKSPMNYSAALPVARFVWLNCMINRILPVAIRRVIMDGGLIYGIQY